ncbi:LppM family (lipo)protein [Bacillus andreraoultii]|uniref:LppM family (lipo)protein n=1 Tax=Bacillus andreraoultii TaxID=1499685 RepID=UPI00067EDACF|nr:hypothetical protein [Bacillus andreraoultii]
MKKKLFVLLLSLFLLSGCVKADIGVKVNENGSVDTSVLMGIDKGVYGMIEGTSDDPIAEMKTDLEDEGFKIEDYETDKYKGMKAKKTFKNIDDFSLDSATATDSPFDIKIDKGLFSTKYTVKGSFAGEGGEISSEEQAMYNQFDLTFTLQLPGKIGDNNAKKVEGNKLTWDLSLNKTTEIKAESTKTNTVTAVISVALLIIIVIGIGYIIFKKKRKVS